MANRTDSHGESASFYPRLKASNTANNNTDHIDALEVETVNNDVTINSTSLKFNQASSISFIVSLISYLWYVVPLMLAFIGDVFFQNKYKALYDDFGDSTWYQDTYERYISYLVPCLIASVFFVVATVIQIYVWFATMIGRNLGSTYKAICIVNVILCVGGCICQVVGIINFEDDAVGDNKYNGNGYIITRIIYQEILYGGFLVVYPLYNIYFTLLLFPAVYRNQFIRLTIACTILVVHCGLYIPYFSDNLIYYVDLADQLESGNHLSEFGPFWRKTAAGYGAVLAGLGIIVITSMTIIVGNIVNDCRNNNKQFKQISKLESKRFYIICIIILIVGLIVYLPALGTTVALFSWEWSGVFSLYIPLATFYVGTYILFGVIVVVVDVCFCYYVR